MAEELSNKKRVRDDSDESEFSESHLPEVKRLKDDLLSNLDDSDLCSTIPDLDSFMKSFEEEISASAPPSPPVAVVDLTSDSGESQPELGYLLEASDDELGLPPSVTTTSSSEVSELVRISSDESDELSELWRFDDQILSYDSFEIGIAGHEDNYNGINNGEYVALDGLFDYSDLGFGSYDGPVPL
ncbi:unnamed protein product [Camellia sinensis]|uniref:Uncharacterized protein n=1 Tax=Camellia sinensis var. sinensis TaxID=542762 RepID=A0A4S4EDM6_CAMSN|nr:uncharacterized protein LOC114272526 [Camellia sinensis]THG14443.1 hypothetical protein TEA_014927 [Camellia sinensis var. sinensis]